DSLEGSEMQTPAHLRRNTFGSGSPLDVTTYKVVAYSGGQQLLYLSRHNEIALGEAVDLVGPEGNVYFAPGEQNVGMMALFLGQLADAIDKGQCLLEVGKLELPDNMVLVHNLPIRDLLLQCRKLFTLE